MMASSGEGWFRRLVPVGGYVLTQPFFLFTVLQAFLERGAGLSWWPFPDPVMFLHVFVPASLPALVVGVVDGVARSMRRTKLFAVLRIFAFLLVTILGLGTALVAAFFLAFTESNLNADIGSLPLGTYLGTLAGMEAVLAVSWGTSVLTERIFQKRRHVREG
jgi:hypothetical protein